MLKQFTSIVAFICISASLFSQNFNDNYEPILIKGDISSQELSSPNWGIFKEAARKYAMDSQKTWRLEKDINQDRLKMLTGGAVYFHDEISQFVQKILNDLLITEPALEGKIKVYVTRYSSVNAISLPEGSIFLNIGLIATMENESQLAAILCHEIAHIKKQHVVSNMQKLEKIKQEEENVYNPEGNMFRNLSFSRDNEFEADAVGLSLLIASKYNAAEMPKALEMLEHLDSNEAPFDLVKLFNTDYYTIDTASISSKKITKWLKSERTDSDNAMILGLVEDIYLTHPEIEKRSLALREILKSTNYQGKGNDPESTFQKIKELARFEILSNSLANGNYVKTLYEGLRLLRIYPENSFVKLCIMKSLYWMSQLKDQDLLENVMEKSSLIPTRNYAMISLLVAKPDLTQFKKLMYGYTKAQEEKLKNQEEFALQLALATEAYLGKEAANVFYRQFLVAFPQSSYKTLIAEKLK